MKPEYTILRDTWETVLAITATQRGTNFNWVFVKEVRLSSVSGELKISNIIVRIFILK